MKFDKIVIEGPNNVGKSTLIDGLMKYLGPYGWEVEHTSNVCPNDFKFYDHLLSNDQRIIFDRLHVGEMVYPMIYGRRRKISQNEFEELLDKHDRHTLIVFLDADYELIIHGNANKKEKFDFSEVRREKEFFYELYKFVKVNNSNCIRIKNHYGDDNMKHVKQILEAIGFDIVQ
jgi:thymidylate kinase